MIKKTEMRSDSSGSKLPRQGQWTLVLMFAIGIVPMVIAYWLFQTTMADGQVWNTTNHGELITPAQPVKDFSLIDAQGNERQLADLETHWTLVQYGADQCEAACQKTLYTLRQLHTLLNKDQDRLQRWFLVDHDVAAYPDLHAIQQAYPRLAVLTSARSDNSLQNQLASNELDLAQYVFLIDPMGNIMMSFKADMDPKLILKDIKKLLRISQVG